MADSKPKSKPKAAPSADGGPIRVRAKVTNGDGRYVGYYGVRRIREGQVFVIKSEKEMGSWMERVDTQGRPINDDGSLKHEDVVEEIATDEKADADESVI